MHNSKLFISIIIRAVRSMEQSLLLCLGRRNRKGRRLGATGLDEILNQGKYEVFAESYQGLRQTCGRPRLLMAQDINQAKAMRGLLPTLVMTIDQINFHGR